MSQLTKDVIMGFKLALDEGRHIPTTTGEERQFIVAWEELNELRKQVEKLTKERDALKTVPMKYRRMQFNAELQDEVTQLQKQLLALAEQNAKMRKVLLRLACLGNGDQYGNSIGNCIAQEALSLPDLASSILNKEEGE